MDIGAIVIQVVVKNVLTMCAKPVSVVTKKMIFKHEKFILDLNAATKAKLYSENKLVFMGDGYKAILILINSSSNPEPVKNKFKAQLKVSLAARSLKVQLTVENTGHQTLSFTGALHTYFDVSHIDQVSLHGQAHQSEWDAVSDTHQACLGQLTFKTEFDRVYDVAPEKQPTWVLHDGPEQLHISQNDAWGQSVVWNPGAEKCSQLKDMPVDGYQRMLCVEAARVTSSIEVPPSQQWEAWQQFTV